MKVKIGNYKRWFGPYQLAELIFFWTKRKNEFGIPESPDWVHKFGEWLAYGKIRPEPKVGEIYNLFDTSRKATVIHRLLMWIHDKRKRKVMVRIDRYDTYDLLSTLALVIVPALKAFRQDIISVPPINISDVPEEFHKSDTDTIVNSAGDVLVYDSKAWEWILDEMIWAFEHAGDDFIKYIDEEKPFEPMKGIKLENGNTQIIGGSDIKFDDDYAKEMTARRDNGMLLFGKYYQSLWK